MESTYQFASTTDVAFTNQLYYQPPTISVTNVPSNALTFVPVLAGSAAGNLASGTTVTLYTDTSSSGYTGKPVATFPYSASNGVLQGVPTIDLSSYAPGVPIYVYATINDGVNTTVTSGYSTPIVPVPNLIGQIVDQFNNPLSGIRVFLDLNNDQTYDAPVIASDGTVTSPGDPSVITNLNGDYYFNDLPGYSSTDIGYPTFRVMAVMPTPSFTPISPANDVNTISETNCMPTASSPCLSIVANFSINRLASITGSLYSDLNQNGVYTSSDPALGGATVYLDASGTGTYQAGDPTCVTGPSGTYGFYELNPTSYTTGIITSTTNGTATTQNYLVTQPSAGTYSVPITSDSQQLTGYTFGVISLATISGNINSQNNPQANPVSIAGTVVNLSTVNTTASVPNLSNFSSTSTLSLNGASANGAGALALLTAGQSKAATSAWYKSAIPLLGGFQTSFQWSAGDSGASSGGFTFAIQNLTNTSVGTTAFGYGGMAKSLAVIFDTVNNQLLIESGGNTANSTALATLTGEQLGFTLSSGATYTTRITYTPSSNGQGTLSVYLSGDSSGGLTPLISLPVNLSSILSLGTGTNAYCGFTAGSPGTGSSASIFSWTMSALNSQTTVTDSSGNYNFSGLMPKSTYTVTQVVPADYVQASPFNSQGIFSQSTLSSLGVIVSSTTTGDFNGDGIPDVAYALSLSTGKPYAIAYAYGKGTGGFDAPVVVTMPVPASAPTLATPSYGSASFDATVVAGNFVTGSRDDIAYIATMAAGGQVVVVYDILNAVVVSAIEISNSASPSTGNAVTPGNAATINNVAVGDLNNDGLDDIAVSTYGGVYTLWSIENLSTPTAATSWRVNPSTTATAFLTPSLYSSYALAYNAGVAIADFNGDGTLDLATIGVQYLPQTTTQHGTAVDTWTSMTVDTSLQIADGVGNGGSFTAEPQFLFQSYSSSNIDLYFSPNSSAPTFPIPFGIAAADISGDGIPDIAR